MKFYFQVLRVFECNMTEIIRAWWKTWTLRPSIPVFTYCHNQNVQWRFAGPLLLCSLFIVFICKQFHFLVFQRDFFKNTTTESPRQTTQQSVCLHAAQMKARNTLLSLFWEMTLEEFGAKYINDKKKKWRRAKIEERIKGVWDKLRQEGEEERNLLREDEKEKNKKYNFWGILALLFGLYLSLNELESHLCF